MYLACELARRSEVDGDVGVGIRFRERLPDGGQCGSKRRCRGNDDGSRTLLSCLSGWGRRRRTLACTTGCRENCQCDHGCDDREGAPAQRRRPVSRRHVGRVSGHCNCRVKRSPVDPQVCRTGVVRFHCAGVLERKLLQARGARRSVQLTRSRTTTGISRSVAAS